MITSLVLLDVAPDPVRNPIVGIAGLILIVVMALMLTAATIVGFVFLLRWLTRKSRRDPAQPVAQFQASNPN
jgi:hypothetical protein